MSLYTLDLQVPQALAATVLQQLQAERDTGGFEVISSSVLYSDLNSSYYRLEIFSTSDTEARIRELLQPREPEIHFQLREDLSLYERPLVEIQPRAGLEFRKSFIMTSPEAVSTAQESLLPQRSQLGQLRLTKQRVGLISDGRALQKPHQVTVGLERDGYLLAKHAGLQAYPLWVETENEEQFIRTVESLSPNFLCVRLSSLARNQADDLVTRITELVKLPIIHAERDELAPAIAAVALNAAQRHGRDPDGMSAGIIGIGPTGISLAELLFSFGFTKVFGIDGDHNQLTRLEKGPGMATSLDHIRENADVIIVCPDYVGQLDLKGLQPEQIVLNFTPASMLRTAETNHFYRGYAPHPVFALPGLAAAVQKNGLTKVDLRVRRQLVETLRTAAGLGQLLPIPSAELIRSQVSALSVA